MMTRSLTENFKFLAGERERDGAKRVDSRARLAMRVMRARAVDVKYIYVIRVRSR